MEEYLAVKVWNLIPVPDGLSLEEAAMCAASGGLLAMQYLAPASAAASACWFRCWPNRADAGAMGDEHGRGVGFFCRY